MVTLVVNDRVRVDQTVLIVYYFWIFSNRKIYMQPYKGEMHVGKVQEKEKY